MKYSIYILFLILTLTSAKVNACTCKTPKNLKALQDYEFENSEFVLIGKVLKIDLNNNTFQVKIIESFKGEEKGKIYNGIYDKYCSPIIDKKGKWLIYGNLNSEKLITINTCGLTRSFESPENNISATYPPVPPILNKKKSKSQDEKKLAKWKLRAKSDLKNEIADLRKRIK
ncbi:hypothetical protein GO009_06435 [Muricauda sp. TY007]|uniref:hypothetical protein n=1 Tax=Allomuricauda sp. TY007 TaxID=2683200 RepID=UPI0013C078EF|nr:hypothetical protein [Muricauda sp. TY007]NDV15659.1 hypothetical protein [Muricauda sp. TY007]